MRVRARVRVRARARARATATATATAKATATVRVQSVTQRRYQSLLFEQYQCRTLGLFSLASRMLLPSPGTVTTGDRRTMEWILQQA